MTHLMEAGSTYDAALAPPPAPSALLSDVQRIFSEITRYPIEILEADANIEEDLGIDSVKLGEIFAALRAKYDLPAMADIRDQLEPQRLRTIAGIASIVSQFGHTGGGGVGAAPVSEALDAASSQDASAAADNGIAAAVAHTSPEALLAAVTAVFADITRYPAEILEADASLEEDLGIDSVKLGEIFAALRERYGLPPMAELRERITAERMRTIGGITGVISEFVGSGVGARGSGIGARVSGAATAAGERTGPATAPAAPSVDAPAAAPRRVSTTVPRPRVERSRRLEGKIALVTCSGRGLGREVARHLADLGAVTIVNSFHSREQGDQTVEEIKRAGGSAVHVWASVASDQQRNALFDQIDEQFGGLDYFVHCASNGTLAPIDRITSEDWDKAFRTNVVGLHEGAVRASRLMQRRGGGRIVTLSMTATDRVFPFAACQSTVKAAIEALTRYLAVELAPYDIRVNCIKAGAIYGDVVNAWPDTATLTPEWERRAPLGRMCRPSDVCALLSALLSDDLEFLTGSTIVLDGGHSIRL